MCYWFAPYQPKITYSAAQTYCQGYPQPTGGRVTMPIITSSWSALDSFASNSNPKAQNFWLGAQFTSTAQTFSDIVWMYNSTFCSGLAYNGNAANVQLHVDHQSKYCIMVEDPLQSPVKWKDQDCVIDTCAAVCEFGKYF